MAATAAKVPIQRCQRKSSRREMGMWEWNGADENVGK